MPFEKLSVTNKTFILIQFFEKYFVLIHFYFFNNNRFSSRSRALRGINVRSCFYSRSRIYHWRLPVCATWFFAEFEVCLVDSKRLQCDGSRPEVAFRTDPRVSNSRLDYPRTVAIHPESPHQEQSRKTRSGLQALDNRDR